MRTIAPLTAATLVLALTACGPGSSTPPGEVQRSSLSRDLSPAVAKDDRAALVDGNTAFATSLYQVLDGKSGNLAYAPYSVSLALAMTYAGARGDTATQMASALHFDLPQDRLHPAFDWLDLELGKRGAGAKGTNGRPFRLVIANALFGQKGFHFEKPFLDTLALNYGAAMHLLDFENASEASRLQINDWVDTVTEGHIPSLLPSGTVNPATRLVLVNAIYFDAAWASPFEKDLTMSAPFHLASGKTVDVPTMHQGETVGYAKGDGWQMVALPYDGNEVEMDLVLPDPGRLADVEAGLDAKTFSSMTGALTPTDVLLSLPKFEVRSKLKLGDTLQSLGMRDAFDPSRADLSGMDGARDLSITAVIHEAWVKVDEEGTEAAAATAVVSAGSAAPVGLNLAFDRPFLFVIRDRPTGAVLFVGRVTDPR